MTAPARIIRFVEQAGIADKLEEIFGYGTTVDDLAMNLHSLDTCSCQREFMFSRVSPDNDRRELPVSTPTSCQHHRPHEHDIHKHHGVLVAESQHKNHVLRDILTKLPTKYKVKHVSGEEEFRHWPRAEYDAERELVVTMRGLGGDKEVVIAQVKQHIDKLHVSRRVKFAKG